MKHLLLKLLDFYQKALSPLHPPCCRFTPTCSAYARQAVEKHGAVKGSLLAVGRVLRCHPFGKSGYDPVPDTPFKKIRRKPSSREE